MSTLGIGTRVWIKWTNSVRLIPGAQDSRMTTAVIVEGPFVGGDVIEFSDGSTNSIPHDAHYWALLHDRGGYSVANEKLLIPIDDDPDATVEPAEKEVMA